MSKDISKEPAQAVPPRLFVRWLRGGSGGFGGYLRVILSTLIIFITSQFLAIFIAIVSYNLIHPGATASSWLDNSTAAQFVYIFFGEGLVALLVWLIVRKRGIGLAAIGLGRKPRWRDLWLALGGFAAFYAVVLIISLIISWLSPSTDLNQVQSIGFDHLISPLDQVLAFVALVILPPLGEETLVRGYLYSGLRASLKFWPALLITSALFGLAHLQSGSGAFNVWAPVADTFLLSAVLVYAREKSGALYAGMAIHMINNLLAYLTHFHG